MLFLKLAEWWDLEAHKIEILNFEVWRFSTKYSNFSSKLGTLVLTDSFKNGVNDTNKTRQSLSDTKQNSAGEL